MISKTTKLRFVAVVALILAPVPASALLVKDQAYEPSPFDGGIEVYSLVEAAQTFTVGRTGTLTALEMYLWRSASVNNMHDDLVVSIRGVNGDAPAAGNLSTVVFPPADVPGVPGDWLYVDLPGNGIEVTTGDRLSIVLHSDEFEWEYLSLGSDANGYPGGQPWVQLLGGPSAGEWLVPTSAGDLAFRTWVDTQVIPIPSGLVLLLGGLPILGLTARSRNVA